MAAQSGQINPNTIIAHVPIVGSSLLNGFVTTSAVALYFTYYKPLEITTDTVVTGIFAQIGFRLITGGFRDKPASIESFNYLAGSALALATAKIASLYL